MSVAVLGIDTATAYAAVGAVRGEEILLEDEIAPDDEGRPRHAQRLLVSIERAADAAGGWEGVGLIAVGLGPGSFTGLRIGIATARALSQAREIPVAGVVTLAALAAGMAERPEAGGRTVLPVIDARRGEAFAALYAVGGTELRPPFVAAPEELASAAAAADPKPFAAGDGAVRFREELEAAGAVVASARDAVHRLAARHVCALGAAAGASAPERIEPIYLREPDAKRWIDRDAGR